LVPTYNEKENIAALIKDIFTSAPNIFIRVVDDNSPDGTARIVQELTNTYPNLSLMRRAGKEGLGIAYIDAFRAVLAEPDVRSLIMMDADFSHDPKEINTMLAKLSDYDVVNGSRYVTGGGIENWKWYRRLLSRFANFYVKTILGTKISDMTTGFICLNKDVLKKIDFDRISSDGYAFLVELKYRFFKSGASFYEHPIIYRERREGQSKMSSGVIWESVWLPWKLKLGI